MQYEDDLRKRHPDWPGRGAPVDLIRHDPPHRSSGLEWWYVNGHFTGTDGRAGSAFVAFFRLASATASQPGLVHSHMVCWALVDPSARQYMYQSSLDATGIEMMSRTLAAAGVMDHATISAVLGGPGRWRPPPPARLMCEPVEIGDDLLRLRYGDIASLTGTDDGCYRVRARSEDGRSALDLRLRPVKPAVKHGTDGIVRSTFEGVWDGMYWYTLPRCELTGSIVADGVERALTTGTGWYDHEFGLPPHRCDDGLPARVSTWKWAGLQLENGWDVSVSVIWDVDVLTERSSVCDATGWAVSPTGERIELADHRFAGRRDWIAPVTGNRYPTEWHLSAPALDIDLTLTADLPEQEVVTIAVGGGFWEGRVTATGKMRGRSTRGVGFVEVLPPQVISISGPRQAAVPSAP